MEILRGLCIEAELKENVLDPRHHKLIIDTRFISYDSNIMECSDIIAIRYGSMEMLVFHKLRTDRYYKIELKDKKGNEMKIFFGHSKLSEDNSSQQENYDKIINSLWFTVKKRLVNEALEKIESGDFYNACNCKLTKDGISFFKKFPINKEIFIPWNEVKKELGFGKFYISSLSNKYHKYRINILHNWNSVVLFSIIDFMLKNPSL